MMRNYSTWLLDLDDTLQVGALSWAEVHLFPELVERTGVNPGRATFEIAFARAQELYNTGKTNDVVGDEFFQLMGWSSDLKDEMLARFVSDYRPALFDDTLAFLDWLKARGNQLYMTTNNKRSRVICQMLGIQHYFIEILTPADNGVSGKPDRGMWDYLQEQFGLTADDNTVLVGNNLTTDGAFARNCGLNCIIVDRYNRFNQMPDRFDRVTALDQISTQIDALIS